MTMPRRVDLDPLIPRDILADHCREAAAIERLDPSMVEKDYYLTRLITGVTQLLEERALLKGGTLLSKADLGFERMSEDVDLVLPGKADRRKRPNAKRMDELRTALLQAAKAAGLAVRFPHGERFERDSHAQWELPYDSDFGPQRVIVEATLRPVLRPARKTTLKQLLRLPSLEAPSCWALDEPEARAEKVRAAFTRRAIRDYYDLERLEAAGKDLSSTDFVALVDAKLAELGAPPLVERGPAFGTTAAEREMLRRAARAELTTVLRVDHVPFDLDAMFARFDALWDKPARNPDR